MISPIALDYNQISDAFAASDEFAAIHDEDVPFAAISRVYELGLDCALSVDELPGWTNLRNDREIDPGDFLVGVAMWVERSAHTGITCDNIA